MTNSELKDEFAEKHAALLNAVLASDDLPTLPTVASKLVTLTSKEETTLADVAELISQVIALSTKILKVSNRHQYQWQKTLVTLCV